MDLSSLRNVASYFAGPSLWVKVIPYAVAALAAGGWFWQYTAGVKAEATTKADLKWEQRLDEFDRLARQRVDEIWKQSSNFANNADTASKRQSAQVQMAIKAIQSNAPAGQYLEIKNGQCVFKQSYVDSFNSVRNTLPGATK